MAYDRVDPDAEDSRDPVERETALFPTQEELMAFVDRCDERGDPRAATARSIIIPEPDDAMGLIRLIPDLAQLLTQSDQHEGACVFAERALVREREDGREPDPRSWAAIEAKRAWLRGEITDTELHAARGAASEAQEEKEAAEAEAEQVADEAKAALRAAEAARNRASAAVCGTHAAESAARELARNAIGAFGSAAEEAAMLARMVAEREGETEVAVREEDVEQMPENVAFMAELHWQVGWIIHRAWRAERP